ncbi:MAG: putative DNA binding domain-containing protein [Prevotella sp.]|nr:putative DNA binding domain-containing protein [Prevotella sp.]
MSLIAEGEHQQQDFKYKISDAVKLAKSVSAFANTDGGRLLIGVRDDGHVSGVRSEEEIFMMHAAAYKYCRPSASIKFDTYHVDGRTLVIATVPPSEHKPVKAFSEDGRHRAYIRVADENIVASPVHLAIWREQQASQGMLTAYDEAEQQLLSAVAFRSRQTLNQIVRRSHLPRARAVTLLARLVRYGLVEMSLCDHQFLFTLVE